jgi:hypothetical protein
MRPLNSKVPSNPGLFVAKKLLGLVLISCILIFFGLAYAGEDVDPNPPVGEHPWDELTSGSDHHPAKPANEITIFPCGHLGGWIIINLTPGNDGHVEKDRVKIHSSDKNQAQYMLLF